MREIKFRAIMYSKSLDKYFVSDGLTIDNGLDCLFGFENNGIDKLNDKVLCSQKFIDEVKEEYWEGDWVHIANSQYTGLKDKNGVEIYEGDILKVASDGHSNYISFRGALCYVEYDEDRCGFRATTGNGYDTHNAFPLNCDATIEIKGNIYENKDLLNDS